MADVSVLENDFLISSFTIVEYIIPFIK